MSLELSSLELWNKQVKYLHYSVQPLFVIRWLWIVLGNRLDRIRLVEGKDAKGLKSKEESIESSGERKRKRGTDAQIRNVDLILTCVPTTFTSADYIATFTATYACRGCLREGRKMKRNHFCQSKLA